MIILLKNRDCSSQTSKYKLIIFKIIRLILGLIFLFGWTIKINAQEKIIRIVERDSGFVYILNDSCVKKFLDTVLSYEVLQPYYDTSIVFRLRFYPFDSVTIRMETMYSGNYSSPSYYPSMYNSSRDRYEVFLLPYQGHNFNALYMYNTLPPKEDFFMHLEEKVLIEYYDVEFADGYVATMDDTFFPSIWTCDYNIETGNCNEIIHSEIIVPESKEKYSK